MRRIFLGIIIFSFVLNSCGTRYLSISNIERYYPSTHLVQLINVVNDDMVYIGKLKVVPSDFSWRYNREKALQKLMEDASNFGANYVYVKGITITNSDYKSIRWDRNRGDGITIEAELYR